MPLLNFQKELKGQIAKGMVELVLQRLLKIYMGDVNMYDQVIQVKARWDQVMADESTATIYIQDLNLERNKIRKSIIYQINKISQDQFAAYELLNANFQPIMVVCREQQRFENMKELLPKSRYRGIDYAETIDPLTDSKLESFDLLIFDNHPKQLALTIPPLLQYYLEHTEKYILYYGEHIPKLAKNKYAERVYFANSIFAIHYRLEEMLLYLKRNKENKRL